MHMCIYMYVHVHGQLHVIHCTVYQYCTYMYMYTLMIIMYTYIIMFYQH